jgi:hypothetical protein
MPLSRTNLLGQITSGNFGTGNFVSTALTPASNSLLVVGVAYVENSGTTTDPTSALTISGGSLTWTQQQTAVAAPTAFPTLVKIWTAPVVTGASMSVTLSAGGVRSAGLYGVSAVCYTGYNTGTPVGGTATGSQNGGFTGPPDPKSITLSAAPAAGDEVFGFVFADKNTAGTSPGSAFTEIDDLNNTNWGSLESEIRTASTSTTVDWVDLRPGGGSIFNFAAVAIVIKAAAAGAQASAQQPIVVSAPRPAPAGQRVLLRNTAALIVPPAKGSLALVVTQPSVAPAAASLLRRNTLADPPVLTTAGPVVITKPGALPASAAPLLLRGSLVDTAAPSTATPGPIVVTSAAGTRLATPVLLRTAPPDQPSPAPVVVTAVSASAASTAILFRSPMPVAAAPSVSTPSPIVVTAASLTPPADAFLIRGTLADPPVLTTASPLVVTSPVAPAASAVIQVRNPQPGAAIVSGPTTEPIVITQPAPPPAAAITVLRSSLQDVPVATPGPTVITSPASVRSSKPIVSRGSLVDFYAGTEPLIVTTAVATPRAAALFGRNSQPFIPPVPGPTTAPIVVTAPGRPVGSTALLLRGVGVPGVITPSAPGPLLRTTSRQAVLSTSNAARRLVTSARHRPLLTDSRED